MDQNLLKILIKMDQNLLKSICEDIVGSQDDSLLKLNGKRCVSLSTLESKQFNLSGKTKHIVELKKDTGITNFTIDGDWEYVEFMVGGQKFDKLYKTSQENTFEFLNNGYCFPYTLNHNLVLWIYGNEYNINYDICSVDPEINEFLIKNTQYRGPNDLIIGDNNLKLAYNHPIEKLTAFTDKKVNSLEFILFGKYKFPFTQLSELKWELTFEKTLNFSRLEYHDVVITCNSSEDNKINIFATSHHIVRILSGMAGLSFTK
jgi:hypothetical protein